METVTVNNWAVLVSAVLSLIVGSLWYSPILFGKTWVKLMGIDMKKIDKNAQKGMWKYYLTQFIASLVMMYVFAHVIAFSGAETISEGIQGGVWMWLGFIATTMIGTILWEQKPFKLYAINAGFHLVNLLIAGIILVSWKY